MNRATDRLQAEQRVQRRRRDPQLPPDPDHWYRQLTRRRQPVRQRAPDPEAAALPPPHPPSR